MANIETDLIQQSPSGARQASVVIAVNPDGSPLSGGGGGGGGGGGWGGGGTVEVSNFPTTQPVTGPLTNAQLTAVTGTASTPMWDGTNPNATLIALLKNIQEQGEALKRIGNETNTLLVQIAEHTRHTELNTRTTSPQEPIV